MVHLHCQNCWHKMQCIDRNCFENDIIITAAKATIYHIPLKKTFTNNFSVIVWNEDFCLPTYVMDRLKTWHETTHAVMSICTPI